MGIDIITAFILMMVAFGVGEVVWTITKAFAPSLFVRAVIFLIGFTKPYLIALGQML